MITDYTTLQSELELYLNRGDLTARIPTFIQLTEAKLRRELGGMTEFDPLATAAGGVNWILTSHADVYLYGALMEAAPYLQDDERIPVWESQFVTALASILAQQSSDEASLTTYAGLQAAIAMYVKNSAAPLIKSFITRAEARLKRDVRVRELTCRGTFSIASGDDGLALPEDFGDLQSWVFDGPIYYHPIQLTAQSNLPRVKQMYGDTGVPRVAAVADRRVYFAPVPNDDFTTRMSYRRRLTPLTDVNTSNWLLENQPDVYLHAALVEAGQFLKDPSVDWSSHLELGLEGMHLQSWHEQFSGVMQQTRRIIGE